MSPVGGLDTSGAPVVGGMGGLVETSRPPLIGGVGTPTERVVVGNGDVVSFTGGAEGAGIHAHMVVLFN